MPSAVRSAAGVFAALAVLSLTSTGSHALPQQQSTAPTSAVTSSKRAQVARAARADAIHLDGKLDDAAWTDAQFISGFTQEMSYWMPWR